MLVNLFQDCNLLSQASAAQTLCVLLFDLQWYISSSDWKIGLLIRGQRLDSCKGKNYALVSNCTAAKSF